MLATKVFIAPWPERTTQVYQMNLVKEDGAPMPDSELLGLTLTLYNKDTDVIINSRNQQSVLNANGGTIDGAGLFTMTFTPEDSQLMDQTLHSEQRVAFFEWTYAAGAKKGNHQVLIYILNRARITA